MSAPPSDEIRRDDLASKGRRAYLKREYIENIEVRKYLKNNPFNKTFISVIKSLKVKEDNSLYVFCFSYAKIQSPTYQNFLRSLTDDNVSKVYIRGFNSSLSRAVGLTPETELRPGLHKVGIVLNNTDGLGVLLTNKTEEEILSKFREYEEFDYAKPGNTPMKTLDLKMPVELVDNGRRIKLTENYVVCEEGKHVTENASKILKHLKIKMFGYVFIPMCLWTASTGQTEYYHIRGSKSE
ncbi:hypothetical protein MKW98_022509 [Papaver atlanticum]|uniref:Uncharacterized protein n=1 Tax=Papaver atlanticum TaxID=357466 RepID=A0AAD4S794_9MAGN|nr:hypothetical protein MKW98_022509 [Papaver atlanticum]